MKIVTIVGARPQFIKAAAVSRELRKYFKEILLHTGQHYDKNMSNIFFDELGIPEPDYNIMAGSGSHAKQTANILVGVEDILIKEMPDYVMVYGDTNSTLAGALAASKLCIPIIHVEAGLRSFNMNMPEEQNRIITDHISSLLFCSTDISIKNLFNEGIVNGVHQVGDVMCDAVKHYSSEIEKHSKREYFARLRQYGKNVLDLDNWYLATIHRAENTDAIYKIREILDAFEELDQPVLFPVHPRTKNLVKEAYLDRSYINTVCIEPIGYLEILYFAKYATKIITDSGGLQKEAYILGTPCITVRGQTEWTETLNGNHNILAKLNKNDILEKIKTTKIDQRKKHDYYGNGNAANNICEILLQQNVNLKIEQS